MTKTMQTLIEAGVAYYTKEGLATNLPAPANNIERVLIMLMDLGSIWINPRTEKWAFDEQTGLKEYVIEEFIEKNMDFKNAGEFNVYYKSLVYSMQRNSLSFKKEELVLPDKFFLTKVQAACHEGILQ